MEMQQRGSEKLRGACTGSQVLTAEELALVAGGYYDASSPYLALQVFPRGIPWPELVNLKGLTTIKPLDAATVRQF